MDEPTRRGFLLAAGAGAVAAALGAAAVTASRPEPAVGSGTATQPAAPAPHGPVVAYVADAGTGRVSVMNGEKEVVVHDPDLVARLARAVAGRGI